MLDALYFLIVLMTLTCYEDDGISNDYRRGGYLKTVITVQAGEMTRIRFVREGNYKTAVETILLDVIHREKAPFAVLLNGREMEHFLDRRRFEEADGGWYYSQTLKSVLVKYKNPGADHEVAISFEQFDMLGMTK